MKRKLIIITTAIVMLCVIGFMIFNAQKEVKLVQIPVETEEPYETCEEWKAEIFEDFGFRELDIPYNSRHVNCTYGEGYSMCTFYTDNFDMFSYFFEKIYTVLWGSVINVEQIMENKDGIYSYEDKCLIPKFDEEGNLLNMEYDPEYMKLYIEFNSDTKQVKLECKKVKNRLNGLRSKNKGE